MGFETGGLLGKNENQTKKYQEIELIIQDIGNAYVMILITIVDVSKMNTLNLMSKFSLT